ncbi:hypothetical protein RTBOTA2_006015 [Rhodotorula toruloides]|nr:hypothetical protein RTBOTA2_006015 [Rhodotorula toruloides]
MLTLLCSTTRATSRLFIPLRAVPALRRLTSTATIAATPPLATLERSNASKFRAHLDKWFFNTVIFDAKSPYPWTEWPTEGSTFEESGYYLSRYDFLNMDCREIRPPSSGGDVGGHPVFGFIKFHELAARNVRAAERPVLHCTMELEHCEPEAMTYVRGNIYEDTVVDELATSPGCTRLRLKFSEEEAGVVENPMGVTIRQVLDLARKHFAKPVADNVRINDPGLSHLKWVTGTHMVDCLPEDCSCYGDWEVEEDGSVVVDYRCLRCAANKAAASACVGEAKV